MPADPVGTPQLPFFASHSPAYQDALRVTGKIMRKCPLTARWLVTSDERSWFHRHAVRGYLSEKKGLQRLI
jgi:hypothetical protein